MGLDVGDRRIGIALSDETRLIATPHSVYTRVGWGPDVKHIRQIYDEAGGTLIVCGLPRNMDGTEGPRAEKSRAFQALLERDTGLPVVLWDERRSSVEAHAILHANGKKMKAHRKTVDAVAASLILEGYLASGAAREA